MFRAVFKATVNAKLTLLHSIQLQKGEIIIRYFSRIVKVINDLDSAGRTLSKIEQKRAL